MPVAVVRIFQRKYLVRWLYGAGLVLLLLTGWLWWAKIMLDPERVFWGMIHQSLTTQGVTMHSVQEDTTSRLEQTIQFSVGARNMARSHTMASQGDARVSTEVVGTKDTDYTRYDAIRSTRRDTHGQPLDFSKVVGVWAKSEPGNSQLLGQAMLGFSLPLGAMPVPIGNLTPEARAELLEQMHHERVYTTDFAKAKKEVMHGRTYYVYDVKIQTIAYVHLMKSFAKAAGLHELDQLDPNTYQGAAPMQLRLKVDARSQRLTSVTLTEQDFTNSFSGYDIATRAALPSQTISADELQRRLDELQ